MIENKSKLETEYENHIFPIELDKRIILENIKYYEKKLF
jgi:hypothetical protein